MTEQPDAAPRRVVKKVVKKTVVRPGSLAAPRSSGNPAGRPAGAPATSTATRRGTARLATPARAQARRSAPPVPPTPPVAVQPAVASGGGIRGRVSSVGHGIGDGVRDAVLGIRHRMEDAWDWLVTLRLPHLSPMVGSAVTGALVGTLSVTIGWGFYEIFSATLGTQAGGKWGFFAFVFLSFVAYLIGEVLLAAFGVPHAHVVSILSVLVVLLLVLVFFLDLASGVWAWLLIPGLYALACMASSAVLTAAAKEKNPQRLPWEPVDESQVKRD